MNKAAYRIGIDIDPVEQQRVRIKVEIESKLAEQRQTQGFDIPARIVGDIPEQLFEQNERQDDHPQCLEQLDSPPLLSWQQLQSDRQVQGNAPDNHYPTERDQPRRENSGVVRIGCGGR